MIISKNISLHVAWEAIWEEVEKAASEKDHPYRYPILGTVDTNEKPDLRKVVLRDYKDGNRFIIFTDSRSLKVGQIENNPSVSLLFWNDEMSLQLRANGKAEIYTDGETKEQYWEEQGKHGYHSYTSVHTPGERISSPEEAFEWEGLNPGHFCVIEITLEEAEFLQLNGIEHLRAKRVISGERIIDNWITP
ncbi:pyridoxamine 5'-phosphate oxidase family protein [Balneola sp. MJW-20]|uniref:pyridoxamine 5'-phosphate oxidase family protein n=1 Tax=Gracilimonas aurantiaca TaxID=3234185 RepID=UPI003465E06D